jgi:hypothetical protein
MSFYSRLIPGRVPSDPGVDGGAVAAFWLGQSRLQMLPGKSRGGLDIYPCTLLVARPA